MKKKKSCKKKNKKGNIYPRNNKQVLQFGGEVLNWVNDNQQGVIGGLKTVAGLGMMATGVGGAMGAGLVKSGVGDISGEIQADAQQAQLDAQQSQALRQQALQQDIQNQSQKQSFEEGGDMNITEYNGNTHQQGGIPINPNTEVENGETRGMGVTKDYVFSEKLKNKETGNSFADDSKSIEKKYNGMDNDQIALKSKDRQLSDLKLQQEALKTANFTRQMKRMQSQYPDLMQGINTSPQQPQIPQQQVQAPNPPQQFETGGDIYGNNKVDILNEINSFRNPEDPPKGYSKTGATSHTSKNDFDTADYTTQTYDDDTNTYYGTNTGKSDVVIAEKKKYENVVPLSKETLLGALQKEHLAGKPVRYNDVTPEIQGMYTEWVKTLPTNVSGYFKSDPSPTTTTAETTKTPSPTNEKYVGYEGFTPNGERKELTPGRPSYGLIAASGLPNAIQSIGLNKMASNLNYDEAGVFTHQPDYLDPTRAIQGVNAQGNQVQDIQRQVATGSGNYMSNLIGSQTATNRGLSDIESKYANANAGITNQAAQYNTTALNRAEQFNTGINMREVQDRIGLEQNALQSGVAGLENVLQTYQVEKNTQDMMAIAGGADFGIDYVNNRPTKVYYGAGSGQEQSKEETSTRNTPLYAQGYSGSNQNKSKSVLEDFGDNLPTNVPEQSYRPAGIGLNTNLANAINSRPRNLAASEQDRSGNRIQGIRFTEQAKRDYYNMYDNLSVTNKSKLEELLRTYGGFDNLEGEDQKEYDKLVKSAKSNTKK